MSCAEYNNHIARYVDGTITDSELAELKTHNETCPSCRDEFDRCVLLQDMLKDAFSSRTPANEAAAALVARLPEEVHPRPRLHFVGGRVAIAAGVVLAVGLLLGFAVGRVSVDRPPATPLAARVPISISKLEGTVLVRHEGADLWHTLETGSDVYLGDTFCSTSNSACVLALNGQSSLELDEHSMLILQSYNGRNEFRLAHGKLNAALESPHPPFFISTPHGRVEALGTEFTVTVE